MTALRRRWLLPAAAAALAAMVLVGAVTVGIVMLTAPAAAPVAVAAAVLGPAAEVFGDGEGGQVSGPRLAEIAGDGTVTCDRAPRPDTTSTSGADSPTAADQPDPTAADTSAGGIGPIPLGPGGSISREDAARLVDPLPPHTSTLRAHVWFLYRLAGLGDWDQFTAAYSAAGFHGDEDSPDAPLRQVQALNRGGADVGRYRLTAAALAAAGEQTGRLADPYPRYRELVTVELMSSCMSGTGADDEQMTLPPSPLGPGGDAGVR